MGLDRPDSIRNRPKPDCFSIPTCQRWQGDQAQVRRLEDRKLKCHSGRCRRQFQGQKSGLQGQILQITLNKKRMVVGGVAGRQPNGSGKFERHRWPLSGLPWKKSGHGDRLQERMSGRGRKGCKNNKNRHLSPKELDSEEVGTGGSRLDQGSVLKFSVCF